MGLRLSLDSSESESNGNPTSTQTSSNYRQNRSINERAENVIRNRPEPNVSTDSSSVTLRIPEVGETPDDMLFLRLLCSYHARSNQIATDGSGRSNSLGATEHGNQENGSSNPNGRSNEASTSHAIRGGNSPRSRNSRHRSSWLGVSGESSTHSGRPHGRRARRTGTFVASRTSHWDSSESDSDEEDYLNNLRLSSVMLRHFQLGSASGRTRQLSVPLTESSLLRTLRLSTARISYNVDRLTQDKGECCICLEDLCEGDVIARLPCLCIYHKKCIDAWFQRRPVCPVHPGD
ncbi:E3 ubiquitin-protein ligase ZNRF2 [Fasciola gigantica]|uniref:RING-type E3 ubiquitin transferase n=1 Tax=Fasciola gigantica TaxID=46835 RepID=A0A504YDD9_FASGI|nr:E3 ubiquitin-protein ligase ZNRF2 [Fasciola gigantica]